MNYPNVNMSIFLGPDMKSIRALLTFLLEYSSKYDEKEKGEVKDELGNMLSVRVQREFARWRNEPWVMSEFLECSRDVYITEFHRRREKFDSAKLVELKGKGSHSLISNATEYVRRERVGEVLGETLRMRLAEGENPEQKLRVDLMQQSFRAAYADRAEENTFPLHSMWERKRIANAKLADKISNEFSMFSQKVIPVSYTHLTLPTTPYV
eukprot:TRINITY_DN10577_c0_g2_i1.p1 TRINITY_DN10577_c0_g2~~TRINITY_DN10577_c0_g2_i1.p1  ORF type:complete len:210 (+),score=68.14 TRINITY_DN10577_c0_g2_i1:537-1166(+)